MMSGPTSSGPFANTFKDFVALIQHLHRNRTKGAGTGAGACAPTGTGTRPEAAAAEQGNWDKRLAKGQMMVFTVANFEWEQLAMAHGGGNCYKEVTYIYKKVGGCCDGGGGDARQGNACDQDHASAMPGGGVALKQLKP
jgi:hypothetical protein